MANLAKRCENLAHRLRELRVGEVIFHREMGWDDGLAQDELTDLIEHYERKDCGKDYYSGNYPYKYLIGLRTNYTHIFGTSRAMDYTHQLTACIIHKDYDHRNYVPHEMAYVWCSDSDKSFDFTSMLNHLHFLIRLQKRLNGEYGDGAQPGDYRECEIFVLRFQKMMGQRLCEGIRQLSK